MALARPVAPHPPRRRWPAALRRAGRCLRAADGESCVVYNGDPALTVTVDNGGEGVTKARAQSCFRSLPLTLRGRLSSTPPTGRASFTQSQQRSRRVRGCAGPGTEGGRYDACAPPSRSGPVRQHRPCRGGCERRGGAGCVRHRAPSRLAPHAHPQTLSTSTRRTARRSRMRTTWPT